MPAPPTTPASLALSRDVGALDREHSIPVKVDSEAPLGHLAPKAGAAPTLGVARVWRSAVLGRLGALERGTIELFERDAAGGWNSTTFGRANDAGPRAVATVLDLRFWAAAALRGSVGVGEAWAEGWWTSPEPVDVARLFVRNQAALGRLERGFALLSRPFTGAFHLMRDNTRRGSRRNIAAHYDLSNDFFKLFLDPTMTYSSAFFAREDATLEEAQLTKIDRLLERLDVQPSQHLLEIGTGWGAFAIRAAETRGCRVTTTTVSAEQHALAVRRVREAGLEHRVDVLLEDYRDLAPPPGGFDAAVSVEMIEAVGARHYPTYFERAAQLLRPTGRFGVQAITIHDRHYDRARREVDFIQRHIFPGCCIPSVTALSNAATRASDMRLVEMEDFGRDYARTLRSWREALRGRAEEAAAIGFDDRFLRLWDFYFSYCEGGFQERHISVAHLVYQREG